MSSDVIGEIGGMPRLGLGTWQLVGPHAVEVIGQALELGYRHIDTAQGYGNEREVGEAIEQSSVAREDIFITTKVWPDDLVDDVRVVEGSLERLGVSQVDLLLLHWPSLIHEGARCIDALQRACHRGYCRHIGISNFPTRWAKRAAEVARLFCHQVEYHPYLSQRAVLEQARRDGMVVTAYSPLAQGEVVRDPVLNDIAAAHGKTPAQAVLRWLLQQPGVAVVPRASSLNHLRQNLQIADFALDAQEMLRIFGLARGERRIDPEFAPPWDEGRGAAY